MRRAVVVLSLIAGLGCVLQAGVLRGIALENLTGLPLARARVSLARLEGDRLKPVAAVIASRSGEFAFASLEEGYYQITGVRTGFAEARFGQRRNNAPGSPIFVSRDGSIFIELRLKRFGAITGRAVDENHVGMPGIRVVAYTVGIPMRIVGSAACDDRGAYRIAGLLPGHYLVRTGPAQLEDGLSLLPTYHPFTSVMVREARAVPVDLDVDTTDVDIQPVPGNLASLVVRVTGCLGVAQVTLSSDTGRKHANAACQGAIGFSGLAPGEYEVLAEGDGDREQKVAAFLAFHFQNDREIGLPLRPLPDFALRLADGAGLALRDLAVTARRRDLAGEGPERALTGDRVQLPPGSWQITIHPPVSHYLADLKVDAGNYRCSRKDADPDWYEFCLDFSSRASVLLSSHPAQLVGRVTLDGNAAIAAPVYLLPITPQTRRRVNGLRTTQTDVDGNYRFDGLAPGTYLVLSSLDLTEVNEETMAASHARTITIEEGRTVTQDLDLYRLP